MQSETLFGVPLSDVVGGGGDPLAIAKHFVDLFLAQTGLSRSSQTLDLGCGCGRIAAALTQHLDQSGSYYGIDIIPGLASFATREITSRAKGISDVLTDIDGTASFWRKTGA
jgi:methylase of polypeptide subunit release factors